MNRLEKLRRNSGSNKFIDYAIDDGISDGETNLNFRNDELMRDKNTNEIRFEASRSKLSAEKKQRFAIVWIQDIVWHSFAAENLNTDLDL